MLHGDREQSRPTTGTPETAVAAAPCLPYRASVSQLLAASILSADFARLGDEVRAAEQAGVDWIHVDVMDGRFVPNITVGPLIVEAVRRTTSLPVDVHLMIEEPDRYVEEFVRAGADYLTVHQEACRHLHATVHRIRDLGARPGVVLNPATPLALVEPVLPDVDLLLLMSVNPGFGGQAFIPGVLDKIREAALWKKRRTASFRIEVDGGIKPGNAAEVARAGAEVLVVGSGIFAAGTVRDVPDYTEPVTALRRALAGVGAHAAS